MSKTGALLLLATLAGCGSAPGVSDVPVNKEGEATHPSDTDRLPVPRFESHYAELKNCYTMEQNMEEGGYVKQRCEGMENANLIVTESDLRQNLAILRTDGTEESVDLSRTVADGAFSSLGSQVEYRGRTGEPARALIGRLDVARGDQPQAPDVSNLFVVRLESPACVVAVVPPGKGQNEKARAIAESARLPDCLG